ncbi:hypothetical protein [Arthrobacter alkaliphilus]|uniref:hypothetical protein n=1 Tax=Arthrobacter alkaliphilus TaxID=369936 RepID=UPI001F2A275C|nr:hypothetical protein [Arthrobacter alkaliphilus]
MNEFHPAYASSWTDGSAAGAGAGAGSEAGAVVEGALSEALGEAGAVVEGALCEALGEAGAVVEGALSEAGAAVVLVAATGRPAVQPVAPPNRTARPAKAASHRVPRIFSIKFPHIEIVPPCRFSRWETQLIRPCAKAAPVLKERIVYQRSRGKILEITDL